MVSTRRLKSQFAAFYEGAFAKVLKGIGLSGVDSCSGRKPGLSKLRRPARPVPDARDIAKELERRSVTHALGAVVHDPSGPTGRMFLSVAATFEEFVADLIRMRTRGGMAPAKPK
ncbi:MAG: hypothetical protein F4X97_03340 [Boseongicola sp. SB0662_bin_57]|nr:hypothetical protein [Boseongicola sp. SB0662_bin_57]